MGWLARGWGGRGRRNGVADHLRCEEEEGLPYFLKIKACTN